MTKKRLSEILLGIGYQNYQAVYLDWVNNFLTIEGFANHHGITFYQAAELIGNANWLYGGEG